MMNSSVFLRWVTVWVASVTFQASVTRGDEVADKIAELKKLRSNVKTLHMVSTSVVRSPSVTRESRNETWEKNADGKQKLKRWVVAKTESGTPKENAAAPILMVSDGVTAWRETDLGDKQLVFKGKSQSRNEYSDIDPLINSGVAKIKSGEKVLDQPCVLLEIGQKANSEDVIASFWISEKHGVVLKSIVKSAGATVTETKTEEFQLDEDIPDSLFTYKPPANAQVVENK